MKKNAMLPPRAVDFKVMPCLNTAIEAIFAIAIATATTCDIAM